jgi:hypothetical protein
MTKKKEPEKPAPKKPEPIIEIQFIKHVLNTEERANIGTQLAKEFNELRAIESQLDEVKASFKAKTAAAETLINSLSTTLAYGFDYRKERTQVVMFPKEKVKRYFLEGADVSDPENFPHVLEKPMDPRDYEPDLPLGEKETEDFDKVHPPDDAILAAETEPESDGKTKRAKTKDIPS